MKNSGGRRLQVCVGKSNTRLLEQIDSSLNASAECLRLMKIGLKWQHIDGDPTLLLSGMIQTRGSTFTNGQGVQSVPDGNVVQEDSSEISNGVPSPVLSDSSAPKIEVLFEQWGHPADILDGPDSKFAMSAH